MNDYVKGLLSERSTRIALLSLFSFFVHKSSVPTEWIEVMDSLAVIYASLIAVRRDYQKLIPF